MEHNEHKVYLKNKATELGKNTLIIANEILEIQPDFVNWTGSGLPKHHHYGNGGLIRHTREVIDLMFSSAQTLKLDIPYSHMFLAGLFHDSGKLWDYQYDGDGMWSKTKHARNIHHISRSALLWSKAVDATGLYKQSHDELLHAILSHHGQREWGSPVMPNSKLAWLLHLCDSISARMDDCERCDMLHP